MVKCAAFGCRSGYDGEEKQDGVSFHCVPWKDKELLAKWVHANPRRDWVPSQYSRLCSLHFNTDDFVVDRMDKQARRKRKFDDQKLPNRRLKNGAVPSKFANTPQYMNKKRSEPRKTSRAAPSTRRENESQLQDILNQSFNAGDDLTQLTLAAIEEKLRTEATAPKGFRTLLDEDKLIIYLVAVDRRDVPQISASIVINSTHNVVVSLANKIVPTSQYSHLVNKGLKTMSQLINLMALIKNWQNPDSISEDLFIETAVECLRSSLHRFDDVECEKYRKLFFLVEQLELLSQNKYGRHYSPQLVIVSYLISAASTAAYDVLLNENVLSLPSKKTLSKVTRRLSNTDGINNSSYLKLRASQLNEIERNVILIIDEIYVAKRVELSGGVVRGLTPDGEVATTLLCFMVKSIAGKYRDIVAMYPMCKLTADKQNECYKEVSLLLKSVQLNVVAISVDNASTNRKFFTEFLCSGTLRTHVVDSATQQPIFLIFDPVHDLKNVYNNFQARKEFVCPPMENHLPSGCHAKFQHIEHLFHLEEGMSLKKAHTLKLAALHPKSIEKTSVKLAVSVFNESTRDALSHYATHEDKAQWNETANFISVIIKLWNVMNVKSVTKGKHKRNYTMDPVRKVDDWKIAFLQQTAEFLTAWEHAKTPGLTPQTFLALRHTCLALAACASYLLEKLDFKFVLLGNLQSDPIESRFGWLRQMSGANYYISTKQVLDSERKIRALSLLKFSKFSLSEVDSAIEMQEIELTPGTTTTDVSADFLAEALCLSISPTANDTNIIYYVSGYIARSIIRTTKCDDCAEVLREPNLEPLAIDDSQDYKSCEFFEAVNRGGLARPTEFTFLLAILCWQVYEEIKASSDLMRRLLSAESQRTLFCKIVDRTIYNRQCDLPLEATTMCNKGHDLKMLIASKFFNCTAKNLVKDLTNNAQDRLDSTKESSQKRKIAKLTSKKGSN